MKPDQWARAWHNPLIQGRRDERRLPAAAREFLVSFGLPRVMIFEWHSPFEISFAQLQTKLVAYNTTFSWGDFYNEVLDREWDHQMVVGEEEFCNGHAAICVDERDGTVNRIDCELDRNPQSFVNSSVELFGMSLLMAQEWSEIVHSKGALPAPESFDELAMQLKRTDPRAFQSEECYWPKLIEGVVENPDDEPFDFVVTSDPARSKPRF